MVNQKSTLSGVPLEIERKFLIKMPDESELQKRYKKEQILQTYLVPTDTAPIRRVRKSEIENDVKYYYTEKIRVSDTTRIEKVQEISENQYQDYLKEIDLKSNPIHKTRYHVPNNNLYFEVDIYPEWTDKAIVEVELESENSEVILPKELIKIREITRENNYRNENLAKNGFYTV